MRTESVNTIQPLAQDNSTFSRWAYSNATRTDDGARLLGIHTMQLEETRRRCHVGRCLSRRIFVSNQFFYSIVSQAVSSATHAWLNTDYTAHAYCHCAVVKTGLSHTIRVLVRQSLDVCAVVPTLVRITGARALQDPIALYTFELAMIAVVCILKMEQHREIVMTDGNIKDCSDANRGCHAARH